MSEFENDNQLSEIKKAIDKVVFAGPGFLDKKISATEMAHTMIGAVEDYAKFAEKHKLTKAKTEEAQELLFVLQEILGCGSGFLDKRCDADCVARTVNYVVNEFGEN